MGFQQTRYEFIFRADGDGIAHHRGTIGNVAMLMRSKVRMPGGEVCERPTITGNSYRHRIRETAVFLSLDAAGLLDDPSLSRGALRLLFSGGKVTGKGDASVITIDKYRELVSIFPVLALFGGCKDNRPLPGQMNVDAISLICQENMGVAPEWVKAWLHKSNEGVGPWRMLTERVQRVTFDPETSPEKVKLLAESEQIAAYEQQRLQEKAHNENDAKLAKLVKSTTMPRSFQRIISGSLFWSGIECRTYTDLEFDAFNYIVAGMISNLKVGGMARDGHGKLTFIAGHKVPFVIQPQIGEDITDALSGKVGTLFRAKAAERREDIAKWLRGQVNS